MKNVKILKTNMQSTMEIFKKSRLILSYAKNLKSFHTSIANPGIKWRIENRLERNPNSFGVLTNQPDFSYTDGRPTPLGTNQKKRIIKQKQIAAQILASIREIDFAVSRYESKKIAEKEAKQKILDNKLKPKGHLLLRKDINNVK